MPVNESLVELVHPVLILVLAMKLHASAIMFSCIWYFIWQRVLSVVWSKGKLGSTYYDTETSQLYLQMDVVETKDFQFLKRGKYAVLLV